MALPKIIQIKESEKERKNLLKNSIPFIAQRLRVLLILKQHQEIGISKRDVAKLTSVDLNSVQTWRTFYQNKGIKGLMELHKTGFKPTVFNTKEHQLLEKN